MAATNATMIELMVTSELPPLTMTANNDSEFIQLNKIRDVVRPVVQENLKNIEYKIDEQSEKLDKTKKKLKSLSNNVEKLQTTMDEVNANTKTMMEFMQSLITTTNRSNRIIEKDESFEMAEFPITTVEEMERFNTSLHNKHYLEQTVCEKFNFV